MRKPVVICLHAHATELACRIAEAIGGAVHGLKDNVSAASESFSDVGDHLRQQF